MTYIRVTGHVNEMPILNTNSSIGYFIQLNDIYLHDLLYIAVLEYTALFLYCLQNF